MSPLEASAKNLIVFVYTSICNRFCEFMSTRGVKSNVLFYHKRLTESIELRRTSVKIVHCDLLIRLSHTNEPLHCLSNLQQNLIVPFLFLFRFIRTSVRSDTLRIERVKAEICLVGRGLGKIFLMKGTGTGTCSKFRTASSKAVIRGELSQIRGSSYTFSAQEFGTIGSSRVSGERCRSGLYRTKQLYRTFLSAIDTAVESRSNSPFNGYA